MPAKNRKAPSGPKAAPPLSDAALELIADRFRALSEPLRLRLLSLLMGGEMTVGQLVAATGSSQANVSKHLSVLRLAGMVSMKKEGTSTLCAISDPAVHQLCGIMCQGLRDRHEEHANTLAESGLL